MIFLPNYRNRRHIWHAGRTDLRLGDAEGRAILLSTAAERRSLAVGDLWVVEVLPASDDEEVLVRYGTLGARNSPRFAVVPRTRRLDDFAIHMWDANVTRALITPGVRWAKGFELPRVAFLVALIVAAFMAAIMLGDSLTPIAWLLPWAAGAYAAFNLFRQRETTAIHREGNKKPYPRGEVLMRLAELPLTQPDDTLAIGALREPSDRKRALERVEIVKAAYGALLTDLVYRIENSALFDPAVEQTREFTLLLARWDDDHARLAADEVASLARELELSFATARAHAEAIGLAHLPAESRAEAGRAVKAVHLARGASTDGERAAAIDRVNRILASLALYYLPDPVETRQALTGSRPQLGTG